MRGLLAAGAYLPRHRVDRSNIAATIGAGGGKGTRAVAGYDEDTTTLAIEAARGAIGGSAADSVDQLWFASSTPTYLEKNNAAVIHAALRLGSSCLAADFGGSSRSAMAALVSASRATGSVLLTASEIRTGLPGSTDEAAGGDAGAALVVGDAGDDHPVLAEFVGSGSATREFLDRWRVPGEIRTRQWEERFGEQRCGELGALAVHNALASAGIDRDAVDHILVSGMSPRAAAGLIKKLGAAPDDLLGVVGQAGGAHPLLQITRTLESLAAEGAGEGAVILAVHLADGADAVILRTTAALSAWTPTRPVNAQLAAGRDLPYPRMLTWRGVLPAEPPRRPEPARMSASAADRRLDWKYGFVGSRDRTSGAVHLPPARVSFDGGAVDDMEPLPMAATLGTVMTFTVDRLAYSPSPPVIFAVVDFDGGGRLPLELTDCGPDDIAVGTRVEMTFRRLNTADGIANYFWKGRPC